MLNSSNDDKRGSCRHCSHPIGYHHLEGDKCSFKDCHCPGYDGHLTARCFEAWEDGDRDAITFGSVEFIEAARAKNAIGRGAKLLHRILAATFEEAMAAHYEKMGWGRFRPVGESADCPNGCGAQYYPQGSRECPNCGKIA